MTSTSLRKPRVLPILSFSLLFSFSLFSFPFVLLLVFSFLLSLQLCARTLRPKPPVQRWTRPRRARLVRLDPCVGVTVAVTPKEAAQQPHRCPSSRTIVQCQDQDEIQSIGAMEGSRLQYQER